MPSPFGHPYELSLPALNKIKGQAIPLASYHVIRDQVLPMITGEHQSIIMYWAGRNLAAQLKPSQLDDLSVFSLELGWGELTLERDLPHQKTFRLTSPFFSQRQVEHNEATFALECGFLTEALAQVEKSEAEGEYQLIHDKHEGLAVQFKIYLEEKKEQKEKKERKKVESAPNE